MLPNIFEYVCTSLTLKEEKREEMTYVQRGMKQL